MKISPSNEYEALSKLLKEWRTEAPLPPRFQEGVWRQIERSQTLPASSTWNVFTHWIGTMLPRPALAASYLAILIVGGATVGWTHANQESTKVKGELHERYLQTVDPYQVRHGAD